MPAIPPPKPSLFDLEWGANDENVRTAQEEEDAPDAGPTELEDGWQHVAFPSGNTYDGEILSSEMHGKGTYRYCGGTKTYDGEFLFNVQHGVGTLTDTANNSSYQGEWRAGKRHGKGSAVLPNGDRFEGQYHDGVPTSGRHQSADGRVYVGGLAKGLVRVGKGTLTQANGDVYEGDFVEGRMTGRCTIKYAGTGKVFTGEVLNGKKVRGKMCFKDGSYYDGEFAGEKPEGKGTRRSKDGDVYTGEWQAGAMSGVGVMTHAPGKRFARYEGSWKADKFHGRGTATLESGVEVEADWAEGKPATIISQRKPGAEPRSQAPPPPSMPPQPESTGASPSVVSREPEVRTASDPADSRVSNVGAVPETSAAKPASSEPDLLPIPEGRSECASALEPGLRVRRMYAKYAPEKLIGVEKVLQRYIGKEGDLLAVLVAKFGAEPPPDEPLVTEPPPQSKDATVSQTSRSAEAEAGTPARTDYRSRVERFYTKYAPEKVVDVDRALAKYEGREDELMRLLVEKYGPEPDSVEPAPPKPKTAQPQPKPAAAPRPTFDLEMLDGAGSSDDESVARRGKGKGKPPAPTASTSDPTPRVPSLPSAAASSSCSGYLDKFSVGKSFLAFGNWQRRFFALDQRGLCYFKPEDTNFPAGIAPLSRETSRLISRPTPKTHKEAKLKERHLLFVLVYLSDETGRMKEYRLLMRAESSEQKARWIGELTARVKVVNDPGDYPETTAQE